PRSARASPGCRLLRRTLLAAIAASLPGCAAAQPRTTLATPFPLPDLPGAGLRPLGGLEIDRGVLGFGGLSALYLAPDLTVSVVSDLARFAEFTLTLDAALRPTGLVLRRTGPLRDGAGRPLARGYAGDAEALARLPNGEWLVAFERWHRIRRYRDLDGPALYVEAPPGLDRAPANGGLEALAVLADGRWLALAEELTPPEAPELRAGWIGGPGAWVPVAYQPAPGLVPVDAAPLPDGGALVLERGFSLFGGFSGRLTRLDPASLAAARAGTALQGAELLRLSPPLPADNYEGVSVVRHAGRNLVALVSDDNENRLQRSLLLLFEMPG
ncbi:esterase-like activity of phytase family protein, partial [Falsiroseomonas oryziterrae]|uniref:esterase-like activity of phytase family protein n=1 Tax=Falsiroseomonas oryziterrae TaxID=2911368 RepID=UPI001F352CBD